jgi:3-deoxy-D-manno-oct-2-ulosonic acid (Kdo) hydroxylase
MPVCAIPLSALPAAAEQSRAWCAQLEAGSVLYFPETPVSIPVADLDFLLTRRQSGSRVHKNIAYKPGPDVLSGVDRSADGFDRDSVDRLHDVMRRYSAAVATFVSDFLVPYDRRWQLDYASYRPIEEAGRDLPMHQRNDLLHTDAFPTRPTRGARILRFFHNIHPTRTRDWIIGEPFPRIVGCFLRRSSGAMGVGLSGMLTSPPLPLPHPDSIAVRAARSLAQSTGIATLVPSLKRTPYDEFMMRLHNTMKEDAEFQRTCAREQVRFAPGSSWMVFTETVPHAVLAGQYALEQTFLVDPAAMVTPESAPVAVLKKMAQARAA